MENADNKYYLKIITKVIILAFIILGFYLAFKVAMFYVPFIIAFLIALLIEPLIKLFMKKTKLKRKGATFLSLIIIVLVIGTILTLIIAKLVSESTDLIANLNYYFTDTYDIAMNFFNDLKAGKLAVPTEILDIANNSIEGVLDWAKGFIGNFFTGLINTITSIPTIFTYGIITILAIIFICLDRDYVINLFKKHVPSKWLEKIKLTFQQMCSISLQYIKAEAKLSLICFVLVFIGLLLMDLFGLNVNYPVIMAIFIGFVDLLPLFGAGAVMVPWAIYLFITGNIPLGIGVIVLWVIWAILKQILEPKMVSKQMGMHPIFTLFGMYTGFKIFGVIGLILGPIILLVIKNVFKGLIEKGILKTFFEQE